MGRLFAFGALLLAIGGCDNGSGTPDAGPTTDLPPLAANTENADPEIGFQPATLDYSCLSQRTRPAGGAAVATTFHLVDFQDDFDVADAEVWLFPSNEIGDTCTAPDCQLLTTDAMGTAQAMLPAGGWYAYRVIPFDDPFSRERSIFGVFQYNEPVPAAAGGTVEGSSVSGVTIDVIPALLGISRTAGLAIVAGRIEDCQGQFVQNAIIRLYDPDGVEIIAPPTEEALNDDPHFHFFNGDASNNLPDLTEPYSNTDGLYVLVQIPYLDERPYRVEAWGNLGGELTLLSCETARIFEDAVTILNMTPVRSDRPASCPAD